MENQIRQPEDQIRQVGITDLFAMIAFVMPLCTALAEVKRLDGSVLGYILVVPPAIVLGGVVVYTQWRIGRFVWRWSEKRSKTVQNGVVASLCLCLLLSIVVGVISGHKMAVFVVDHLNH